MVAEPARLAPSRVTALAVWGAVVLCVAFVLRGGVVGADQAVLHGLVAVGAAIAATLPSRVLASAGSVRSWAIGAALVLLVLGVGLVPLPSGALAVLAPGLTDARPRDAFHTLSFDAEATVTKLGTAVLVLGYAFVVGVWGGIRRRRHLFERAILVGTAVLVVTGLLHRVLQLDSVFGVIATSGQRGVLFGPLVNQNHMGTVVLLGLPVATAQLVEHENQRDLQWVLSLVVLIAGLALLVAIGSPGVLVAGAVVVGLARLLVRGGEWDASMMLLVALGMSAVAIVGVIAHETMVRDSVAPRGALWSSTLRMFADHWFAGVGGGSYSAALPPYRTDGSFRHVSHAHSDPLEWLAETGVVGGMLSLGVIAAWWPRRAEQDPARARAVDLGLIGVAVHTLVDFPLQIPAVAMAALAVLAGRATVFQPRRAGRAWGLRGALLGLVAAELAFGAWQWRGAHVDAAITAARDAPGPATLAAADEALSRWAPWRAQAGVVRAWRAEAAGDAAGAVEAARSVVVEHPEGGDSLRQAALVLVRGGQLAEAEAALERAAVRGPNEQRTWVALARLRRLRGDVDGAVEAFDMALACSRPGQNLTFKEAFDMRPDTAFWVTALADSPSDWSSMLASHALRIGRPEDALAALEQAGRIDAMYLDDLRVARALAASGRAADAEAWLRARTERLPEDADGWIALGGVLDGLGRHEEAGAAFLVAIDLRPSDVEARLLAIRSAEARAGDAEALKLVRRFEASGHPDGRLSLEAARLLYESGESGACIVEIESHGLRDQGEVVPEAQALFARCASPSR